MLVQFNTTKTRVLFSHEDAQEYKFLHRFPGFIKDGPYFYAPAKSQVVHNLYHRLKRSKKKLRVSQEVLDFMEAPFVLKAIPEDFNYFTTPMNFQEIALRYLYTVGSGGILLDPGMGKSKVILDYIALMGFKKALIVCPLPLLFVWEDEIHIHRPDLTFHTVNSTDWAAEKAGIAGAQDQLKTAGFEFMHLDEFLIKDPSTERTKALTDLSYSIPYRAGGSGTLVNNSVKDVFAPVRYLEPALVGRSSKDFIDRFAVKVLPRAGEKPRPSQIVAFKGVDECRSILESCCIVMTKEKWMTLPPKHFHDIYVPLNDEQREAYWSLSRNYIANIQGTLVEIDNALVKLSKLYQISNGFIYHTPPGEESETENEVDELLAEDPKKKPKKLKRETIFFENGAKIQALRKLVCETIPGRRAIVWFNMSAEFTLIKEMLEREGKTFLSIRGGEKGTGAKVRKFNTDPSIDYLVCQAKSVNYGITVLGTTREKLEDANFEMFPGISPEVHTEIFYSMNFSLEVYLQQQDRIHRLGQTHPCDYYRLFASTPVEKKIREAIGEKLNIRRDVLVDIAEKIQKEADVLV